MKRAIRFIADWSHWPIMVSSGIAFSTLHWPATTANVLMLGALVAIQATCVICYVVDRSFFEAAA